MHKIKGLEIIGIDPGPYSKGSGIVKIVWNGEKWIPRKIRNPEGPNFIWPNEWILKYLAPAKNRLVVYESWKARNQILASESIESIEFTGRIRQACIEYNFGCENFVYSQPKETTAACFRKHGLLTGRKYNDGQIKRAIGRYYGLPKAWRTGRDEPFAEMRNLGHPLQALGVALGWALENTD